MIFIVRHLIGAVVLQSYLDDTLLFKRLAQRLLQPFEAVRERFKISRGISDPMRFVERLYRRIIGQGDLASRTLNKISERTENI